MSKNTPSKTLKMTDIAKAVGVSAMTVSRAFRGESGIDPRTRAAILSAAEKMGYVFDATAANLRQNRTGFVAVTVPSLNNANFAETVRQLSAGLSKKNIQILLANTEYDADEEERLIEQLLRRKPEAIVLTGGQHTKRTQQMLTASPIPVVEMWDLPEAPIQHVVGFSNALSVRGLVDHFVKTGYSKIGFLGGESAKDPRGVQRRAGFVDALTDHGLDTTRLVPTGVAPVGMAEGVAALDLLLERFPDTQAVICVSDLIAFGVLSQCQRRGLRIPHDLAVAGFGNYEIGQVCVPSLTTIDVHAGTIGARTAELILDLLSKGPTTQDSIKVAIKPDLILRESCR